ncbi:MAG: type II toxin-antitoxin system MqsR family toxin [Gemmatimonadetes bacterium]|nr:type II toxin-antitoxin system MqsR family toxin [Gemmatimonadota bacterium]
MYDLREIQRRVRAGEYLITAAAQRGVAALALDEGDVVACVLELRDSDFFKSMESELMPGLWQDVYRPVYQSTPLYVKLQIRADAGAVVISFKRRWHPWKARCWIRLSAGFAGARRGSYRKCEKSRSASAVQSSRMSSFAVSSAVKSYMLPG